MELEESTCLTSSSTTKPQSSREYGTAQRQKHRSMEQNRKPRDKSIAFLYTNNEKSEREIKEKNSIHHCNENNKILRNISTKIN